MVRIGIAAYSRERNGTRLDRIGYVASDRAGGVCFAAGCKSMGCDEGGGGSGTSGAKAQGAIGVLRHE
jgi:hypothetical protein